MTTPQNKNSYAFSLGIENIDTKLIRNSEASDDGETSTRVWTAAIVGPDGTGKSILALHAAIEYLRANGAPICPKVIYVSTDLSFSIAARALSQFGLLRPNYRRRSIDMAYDEYASEDDLFLEYQKSKEEIRLVKISPSESKSEEALKELADPNSGMQLFFVDLQADSAGDDWHFVNQLLGLFPGVRDADENRIPNLLVIDAVEGLEAYVGDIDTFGQKRTRRSRIAQLSRICSKAGYNTIFVVERDNDDRREPEQFIADYVFSLGNRFDQDYLSRTIEIEKFRGCWHARGVHELSIRQGKGAYTGRLPNLDEPPIPWSSDFTTDSDGSKIYANYLSHIMVTPSLHFENRDFRERRRELNEPKGKLRFGLPLLDKLLDPMNANSKLDVVKDGSITLLLGDAGTHKSRLARKYLINGLGSESDPGVCIYLTTMLLDKVGLAAKLIDHNTNWKADQLVAEARLCVRRLSVRHLTSSHLLRIVDSHVRWAKWQLKKDKLQEQCDAIDKGSAGQVHLVIDDWHHIVETHPNIARDPLFLQSLIANLKREGVSALIVSTQPGQPFVETQDLSRFDLRKIDEQHIYAWNTSFFGERRTAITCLNDQRGRTRPTILELRPEGGQTESVEIGREFALYEGIENGEAKRVPLEIRLVGPNREVADHYLRFLQDSFSKVFSPAAEHSAVSIQDFERYDQLAAFADWLDDSRLGKTLILQIDEFWRLSATTEKDSRRSLMDIDDFWHQEAIGTFEKGKKSIDSVRGNDFYGVWQALPIELGADGSIEDGSIKDGSLTSEYWKLAIGTKDGTKPGRVIFRSDMVRPEIKICPVADRVPYLWDFGFLVADRSLWNPYMGDTDKIRLHGKSFTIKDVWNALCLPGEQMGDKKTTLEEGVTWEEFLATCSHIASYSDAIPLDVDMLTSETLSSLFLEVWGSLALQYKEAPENFKSLEDRCPSNGFHNTTVRKLLTENMSTLTLASVLLLRACPHLSGSSDRSFSATQPRHRFVASRQWYSTATQLVKSERVSTEQLTYLALPGSYSTRGDWFLAVASGSRSQLLAERAIDLLTSRKMNLIRLHAGLGLPARDILAGKTEDVLGTALPRLSPLSMRKQMSKTICFGELHGLGSVENQSRKAADDLKRRWLWRSRIKDYDRDSFYFRRWIGRILFERDVWFGNCGVHPIEDLLSFDLQLKNIASALEQRIDLKHLENSIEVVKSALRTG